MQPRGRTPEIQMARECNEMALDWDCFPVCSVPLLNAPTLPLREQLWTPE